MSRPNDHVRALAKKRGVLILLCIMSLVLGIVVVNLAFSPSTPWRMSWGTRTQVTVGVTNGSMLFSVRHHPVDLRTLDPDMPFFHGSWHVNLGPPKVVANSGGALAAYRELEYGGGGILVTREQQFLLGAPLSVPVLVLALLFGVRYLARNRGEIRGFDVA